MATVLTSAGEAWVVDVVDGTVSPGTHYIGWGTGAGTAAKADTTLFTEAAESRVSATKSQPSVDKNRWVGTITASGSKTITNAGVFDTAVGGTMIIHGDFTGIAVASGDKIEFTIDLEQT